MADLTQKSAPVNIYGNPWANAIMTGIGVGGGLLFPSKRDKMVDFLNKELMTLAEEGVDVGKLAAPAVRAAQSNYGEAMSREFENIYSQGLGNTGALTSANLAFTEGKNKATGDAYAKASAQNEQIKMNALNMLKGMLGTNLGDASGEFGKLAGAGGYNLLNSLLG